VTVSSFLALLPLLLALSAAQREQRDEPRPSVRQLVVERQWIVRVPVRPRPLLQRLEWTAGQGYKCVRANAIRGAFLSGQDSVDFVLRRQRVRATLDGNCTALDFYDGFYLKTGDERVCAGRDFVHSRMGGSCRIERFQKLLPKLKD
jgi:hypothetical protein